MALYENVWVARQDVAQAQVEALTTQFADLVTSLGGTVSKKEYWGLRSLTYRIKKNRKGHYTLMNMAAAICVLASLLQSFNLASAMIQVCWIAISLYGLARLRRERHTGAPVRARESLKVPVTRGR